jgi:NADPH-dependent ferric siderophore reductase
MATPPSRREPPAFRVLRVVRAQHRTPTLVRVTLGGPELAGLDPGLPAASIRLLLPRVGGELVVPRWNGNEFLEPDGRRPLLRTLTPLRLDAELLELDVEVVLHGEAPLSHWAASAAPGDPVAISGTGRGYSVDPGARSFLLAGDESAVPAMGTVLPALPAEARVTVVVERRVGTEPVELPAHPGVTVRWCELAEGAAPGDALVPAVEATSLDPDVRVWAAGEAAAVQRLRRHLFEAVGLPRSQAVVRGYWKRGRAGAGGE